MDIPIASIEQSIRGFSINLGPLRAEDRPQAKTLEGIIASNNTRILRARIEFSLTESHSSRSQQIEGDYLLGDGQDAGKSREEFLGHGALLTIKGGQVSLRTSLTGLPPSFIYQDGLQTVIASSIDRIATTPGVRLSFDARGLAELAKIGKPINYRTLFQHLTIVPAGTVLQLSLAGGIRLIESWQRSEDAPFTSWQDYIDAQEQALAAALRRMDLSRSFLSLTAGLDTRAILALLCRDGIDLPALTKSGSSNSLDAKRAKELCDAYNLSHKTVFLDGHFTAQFSQCAFEASYLSGGLTGFSEASEVYFYKNLGDAYTARLSGILGNQIGRSGTEGASMRDIPITILANDFLKIAESLPKRHWFETIANGEQLDPLRLIQQESLFASIANFCIGQRYVKQQTPYADRTVILQKLREPALANNSMRCTAVRARDLKHRFLGDPRRTSFQRQLVARTGGPVDQNPINWGWRASGAISPSGMAFGILALLDVVINTRLPKNCLAARIFSKLGISGFSGFEHEDFLTRRPVAEFVYDTLKSDIARGNSALNQEVLRRALDTGFNDRSARKILLFALDVVLAQRNFDVSS